MGDDWGSEDELEMLVAERLEAAYEAVMGGPSEASGSSEDEEEGEEDEEEQVAVFDLANSDNDGEPGEQAAPAPAPALVLVPAPPPRPAVRGAPQRVPARSGGAGGDESDGFEEVAPVRASRKRPRAEPEADAAVAALKPQPTECTICYDPCTLTGRHRLAALKCGHLFGKKCIERWVAVRSLSIYLYLSVSLPGFELAP